MLKDVLDSLKEYRKYLSDTDLKTVSIVCYEPDIEEAVNNFKTQYPDINIEKICIYGKNSQNLSRNDYQNIQVEKIEDNFDKDNLAVYTSFVNSKDEKWKSLIDYVNNNKKDLFYYYTDKYYETGTALYTPPYEDLFNLYEKEFENVYKFLETTKSKMTLAQRLRALIEGKSGYLKNYGEEEYFPREVNKLVEKGDTVIDAGISCFHPELLKYSEMAGKDGEIIAFEASPVEYKKILADWDFEKYKNIKIENLGLWDSETTLMISDDIGGSSVVYDYLNRNIECKLVKLDDYVQKNNIKKVDYIKMDIEGAEINALKGAEKTIKKYHPKLAICVYHEYLHLFQIFDYINSLYEGYRFYLCHHSSYFPETVLYAHPADRDGWGVRNLFFRIKRAAGRKFYLLRLFLKRYTDKILISKRFSKKLVIYGTGVIYNKLKEEGFFKDSNIIALCDKRFTQKEKFDGYEAIPPEELSDIKPDRIYIAMKHPDIAHLHLKRILDKKDYEKLRFINYAPINLNDM